MPSAAHTLAIDRVEDREFKWCARCGHRKARDQFNRHSKNGDGLQSRCRDCQRIGEYVRYHEGGGKAAKAAYQARKDVTLRQDRESYEAHREAVRARTRAWRASPKGRLYNGRYQALKRLATASNEESRARTAALVVGYDRQLARLGIVLPPPAETPKPRAAYGSKSPCRGIHITKEGTYKVKVSDGKGSAVQGGTFKTLDEAKAVANALGRRVLGIDGYADAPARGKRA